MSRIKFSIFILLVVIISGCGGGSGDEGTTHPVEPTPVEPPPPLPPPPPPPPPPPVEPTPVEPPLSTNPVWQDFYNNLEHRPWWEESKPYSCEQPENPDSPWVAAKLIDLGGSDPLSLIRYFGNGSYLRYEQMGFSGCTPTEAYHGFHIDPPVDPTYYSLGDLGIDVDIARVPPNASGWFQDNGSRDSLSMNRAVELLNRYVAPYWRRVSEDKLRITFREGIEFTVGGDGSPDAMYDQHLTELGICVGVDDCEIRGLPGALNRMILSDVSVDMAGQGANGWARFGLVSLRNADMELVVHEMGHAWMDWPHSFTEIPWLPSGPGGAVNPPNPYSNFYDVMSQLDSVRTRGWNVNMPSTMAINRYSAGWIRPEDVALHLQDTGTYRLSKPRESGYQFLVIHSGRRHAFTTLEVLDYYPSEYRVTGAQVYDSGRRRPRRYEGVLVSRYDQSAGTGAQTRTGPALYDKSNPNRLADVGWGRDDYSVIQDGETREIGGGVSVSVRRNSDGSYEVTVSGGKVAEFQRWCFPLWFRLEETEYDTGCRLNEPLSDF